MKMKSTQTLPSSYVLYKNFKPAMWKKTHWIVWIIGIALAWLSYKVLNWLAFVLRPDYQPHALQVQKFTLERMWGTLILIIILIIVFAIHELIHAVFLYYFTGHFPRLVIGTGSLAIRLPDWHIPRDQFLITNLAPFIVITLLGILLLPVVPLKSVDMIVFFTALNAAGSIADIVSSAYLYLCPPSIYVDTEGTIHYNKNIGINSVTPWKIRIRSLFESAINLLDPTDEVD